MSDPPLVTSKVSRAYRFRLYPSRAQAAELAEWERQLRWLWNLAQEQRLLALQRPREGRPRVDYFRQAREMTEIVRAPGGDQLARIVCSARQEVLRDLDRAWQRFWKRLGGKPRFKSRDDSARIYLATTKHWRLEPPHLVLAGVASSVGPLEIRQDRPWPGDATFSSCSIVRDVDQWYAAFPLRYEVTLTKPKAGAVGINRGAIHAIADSEGRVVESPRYYERALERIQLLSRRLARKVKGSKNRMKAAMRLARAHRRVRRQRAWWIHQQSAYYASRYTLIALEDVRVREVVESPASEERRAFSSRCKRHGCEEPTYRRRLCRKHWGQERFIPKSVVRRSILDAGWYALRKATEYKAAAREGEVLVVPPGVQESTSIRTGEVAGGGISSLCSGCGAPIVRASGRALALCDACSRAELGDTNAARNVLLRALAARRAPKAAAKAAVTIQIKGRAAKAARPETSAKPADEACGGEAPVGAPVEAGTSAGDG